MSKSTHSTITRLAIILALAMLAVVLVDAACASLQALAQHRLIAEGTLVLAVASAFTLGIAIGRRKPDAAVVPGVRERAGVGEPVTASGGSDHDVRDRANMSHELHAAQCCNRLLP